ncbi:hypothetical protein IAU59_005552 [Kwoniella sp. CBS 9459]
MPPNAAKTIFVANIPYDVSEEQLANTFSEAGPVQNVEIKFDPQTGRSKGYAFVQFYDEATAMSAVRNLQDAPVNGRNLRVELSTDEPGPRRGGGGGGGGGGAGGGRGGGPRGDRGFGGRGFQDDGPPQRAGGGAVGGAPGGFDRPAVDQGYGRRPFDGTPGPQLPNGGPGPGALPLPGPGSGPVDLSALPVGQDLPPGQATDAISKTLAAIAPGQMQDVMASMKTLIMTNPDQARQLLSSKPQLAYALFQAMLLMNIIDPSVLNRIQPIPSAVAVPPASYPPAASPFPYGAPAPQSQPPPSSYPSYPPTGPPGAPSPAVGGPGYRGGAPPPPVGGGYNAGPPAPVQQPGYGTPQPGYGAPPPSTAPASGMAGLPPSAQAALATLPEDQQAMLLQVLQLTPDQISALDPTQKASIMQLRQQFLGAAA